MNLPNLSKKNKINNLKINVIINNTAKTKGNDDPNFLNNKDNLKRGNKLKKRFNNKKTIIRIEKFGLLN